MGPRGGVGAPRAEAAALSAVPQVDVAGQGPLTDARSGRQHRAHVGLMPRERIRGRLTRGVDLHGHVSCRVANRRTSGNFAKFFGSVQSRFGPLASMLNAPSG